MKSNLRWNFAIILLFAFLDCLLSRGGIQQLPFEEIQNDEFNPFNAFLNFDRMAKDIMSNLLLNKTSFRSFLLICLNTF